MQRRSSWVTRSAAILVAIGLLLAACGGSDSDSSDSTNPGGSTGSTTAPSGPVDMLTEAGFVNGGGDIGTPTKGGSITMGVISETNSLDPVVSFGSGYAGATEMAAIFDVLVRYDVTTGEYVPQMAQSLTPNATSDEWTLKLRPNIKFSDGTPLDATAVKISMDRQAAKGRNAFIFKGNITSIDVVDPLTVSFKLNKQWTGFPYVLAYHTGFVTHPNADAIGEDYGKAPIGAGPYTVERYTPGDVIILKARDDYWDGRVNVDTLQFKYLPGAQANLDAIQSGTFQVALLGDAGVATTAVNAGYPGYVRINYSNGVNIFNMNVDTGRALTDQKIRQAIAHATEPEILNQRVWGGKALPSSQLYGETSRWYQPIEGLGYDPAKAKQLVDEAKQSGWDGKIQLVSAAVHPYNNAGLAMQAMMQAVGITVDLQQPATLADQTRQVNGEKNFDVTTTGYALDEADPYVELSKKFASTSVQNIASYKSPEMDALLTKLAGAKGDDALDVIGEIQEQFNKDSPGNVWTSNQELLAWGKNVHGILPSVNAIMLFTEAWIG